jgi:putative transcriptional regulator
VRGLRVFARHAAWEPGQLAAQINRGDWLVVPALPKNVRTPPGTDLWSRILPRQGLPLTLLATYPADPVLN